MTKYIIDANLPYYFSLWRDEAYEHVIDINVRQKSVDDVKLSVKKRQLKFNNNQKAKLFLQLKNLDQNIPVLSLKGQNEHLVVVPKRVGVLKASETREVALDVFAKVSRDDPRFIDNTNPAPTIAIFMISS